MLLSVPCGSTPPSQIRAESPLRLLTENGSCGSVMHIASKTDSQADLTCSAVELGISSCDYSLAYSALACA
jgi:hypothetical protein